MWDTRGDRQCHWDQWSEAWTEKRLTFPSYGGKNAHTLKVNGVVDPPTVWSFPSAHCKCFCETVRYVYKRDLHMFFSLYIYIFLLLRVCLYVQCLYGSTNYCICSDPGIFSYTSLAVRHVSLGSNKFKRTYSICSQSNKAVKWTVSVCF